MPSAQMNDQDYLIYVNIFIINYNNTVNFESRAGFPSALRLEMSKKISVSSACFRMPASPSVWRPDYASGRFWDKSTKHRAAEVREPGRTDFRSLPLDLREAEDPQD